MLKQKKFEELRRLYLLKRDDDEKIVPRKKDLNPFLREELPALPILNRYRSQEKSAYSNSLNDQRTD